MTRIEVSVVVPMHNESANLPDTVVAIAKELRQGGKSFEVIAIDDGSSDDTPSKLKNLSKLAHWLKVISYQPNQGRGYALREGIGNAQGEIICTIDADLSYTPDHLSRIIEVFDQYPRVDCVVGSPYMSGGATENVPGLRLWLSRLGNKVLSRAIGGTIKTSTGVLRGYRASCIKNIELSSKGKEFHLEVLSKLQAAGYNIIEIPATLRGRKRGKSKFNFRAIASSHLLFSLHEKPMLLFGLIGALFIGLGMIGGSYIVYLWQTASLNPNRPLLTLVVLLVLSGVQVLMFGFLGSGIVRLRKEILIVQRENKDLENKLDHITEKDVAKSSDQKKREMATEAEENNQETASRNQPSATLRQ